MVCLALAIVAFSGIASLDLFPFLTGGGKSSDIFKLIIYKLVSLIDFPLIAFFVGSLINAVCCGWLSGSADASAEIAEPELAKLTLP